MFEFTLAAAAAFSGRFERAHKFKSRKIERNVAVGVLAAKVERAQRKREMIDKWRKSE